MDIVRAEVERADYGVSAFLLLQSLAGGTGSGLGARVGELLRDEYGGRAVVANTLVAPYSAGEVSVQLYNSLLTLTHTAQSSDAVMLFRNDQVQSICRTRMRIQRPSFDDLNKVIARHLASALLLPSATATATATATAASTASSEPTGAASVRCLEESVAHLCAHPSYRMLGVKMLPQGAAGDQSFGSQTWRALLRRLHQMQLDPDAFMEDNIDWSLRGSGGTTVEGSVNRTLAATLTLRGVDARDFVSSPLGPAARLEEQQSPAGKNTLAYDDFEHYRFPPLNWESTPGMFVKLWSPSGLARSPQLSVRADPFVFDGWERTATLVGNSQSIVAPLTRVALHAREMWEANAYVHQYEMHGFERDELAQAFEDMDQIVHNYTNM
jgi:tubulin delta